MRMIQVTSVVLAMSLASCDHPHGEAHGPATPPIGADALALLRAVPGDAFGVWMFDPHAAPWDLLKTLSSTADGSAALDKELRAYMTARLGLDVSGVRVAVGFVTGMPPAFAVLVQKVPGQLVGATAQQGIERLGLGDEAAHVIVAHRGDMLAIGQDRAIQAAFDAADGKAPNLAKQNPELSAFFAKQAEGAVMAVAFAKPAGLPVPAPWDGLQRAGVSLARSGARAVVEGDPATLAKLQQLVNQGLDLAVAEAEREKQAALAPDAPFPAGAGLIIAAHLMHEVQHAATPHLDGGRMVVQLAFPDVGVGDPMMLASVAGVLAAVAVPSYMKYMERAKRAAATPPAQLP